MDPYVVVGAGLAGAKAVETLRAEGFGGPVVLLGAEPLLPYQRPPMSKAYLTGRGPRGVVLVHDADWYAGQKIEVRTSTPVTALDPAAHELTLAGGERLRYAKVLLATGSTVRPLRVPGGERARTLRTFADAAALKEAIAARGQVVVIGAGWIGLEVAAAARGAGGTVTLVELGAQPLAGVLGPELGAVFAGLHAERGVDVRTGTGVRAVTADAVELSDGTSVPADLVVAGVGVDPDTRLAAAAGLPVDDGVLVDAAFRTADPDVYAAGDIAAVDTPGVGRVRVEHWDNALHSGPAAARSMLGRPVTWDRLPYFFSDQYDLSCEYRGWAPPGSYDQVLVRGSRPDRRFHAFWLAAGRVRAALAVNADAADLEALLRRPTPPDPTRLTDPTIPLPEV